MKRVKTPLRRQMEARECGAVALGIILAHYGRYVPPAELRAACGTSRDGVKVSGIVRAARQYGLKARAFRLNDVRTLEPPFVIFWNFNHFLVIEGYDDNLFYVNDPAAGYRLLSQTLFDQNYSGIALAFEPDVSFTTGGQKPSLTRSMLHQIQTTKLLCAAVIFVELLQVVKLILLAFVVGGVVEQVISGTPERGSFIPPVLLCIGLHLFLNAAEQILYERLARRGTPERFFRHLLKLPMSFFSGRYNEEISGRAVASYHAETLLADLLRQITAIAAFAIYAVTLLLLDVPLAVLSLALAASGAVLHMYVRGRDQQRQDAASYAQERYSATLAQANLEDIRLNGSEGDFFNRLIDSQAVALSAVPRVDPLAVIVRLLPIVSVTILLIAATIRLQDRPLPLSIFVTLLIVSVTLLLTALHLTSLMQLRSFLHWSDRLNDVLETPLDPYTLGETHTALVSLRNVTFGYDETPIVRHFSLEILSGQRIGLVGRSGSGKSSIVKLAAGVYAPQSGEVALRQECRMALVDDESLLVPGTIAENLRLFNPYADDAQIWQAAHDVGLDEIDRDIQHLSQGERQGLEIARALVGQPDLLLLDEAVGDIDVVTVEHIFTSIQRRGCACVIVSHHLKLLRDCDFIVVIENGQAVQSGTWETLQATLPIIGA